MTTQCVHSCIQIASKPAVLLAGSKLRLASMDLLAWTCYRASQSSYPTPTRRWLRPREKKTSMLLGVRRRLETGQVARDVVPRRPFANEHSDGRPKPRGVVERTGIHVNHARHHLGRTVDYREASRAGKPRRRPPAASGACIGPRFALDRDRAVGKAQESDMPTTTGALAAPAMAEPLQARVRRGPPAERPAGALAPPVT